MHAETLTLIVSLAPVPPLFRLIQRAHQQFRTTSVQQFMVRCRYRQWRYVGGHYGWALPDGRSDGPFINTLLRGDLSANGGTYCVTGYYRSGKICGIYSIWYSPVQIRSRCVYINGLRHGDMMKWYPTGQLHKRCIYVDGRRHGEMLQWYPSGQLRWCCNYAENQPHGTCSHWYTSGQLYKQYSYANGYLHGECKTWAASGQLIIHCAYNKASPSGMYHRWFESGQLYEQYEYDDRGRIHGIVTQWCESKQTYKQYNYVNGIPREQVDSHLSISR